MRMLYIFSSSSFIVYCLQTPHGGSVERGSWDFKSTFCMFKSTYSILQCPLLKKGLIYMKTEIEISDRVVRKNNLINAQIRLNAKEYDLVRTFMKYIKKNDSNFWSFSVLASELGINNSRGKPMVKSIQRKPLEIEIGKDGLVSIPFFSMLKYNNGVFEVDILPIAKASGF